MFHALTYYTHIDNQTLLEFKEKYDPTSKIIPVHIGIVVQVPDEISEPEISDHIFGVLLNW